MKFLRSTLLAAGFAALAAPGHAAPIDFDIASGGYTTGSGYGCAVSNLSLCVTFTQTIGNPAPFTLDFVGDFETFTLGSVALSEPDEQLQGGEQDNLGVSVFLNFSDPFLGQVTSVAVVGSVAGQIDDAGVDYTIDFSPVIQNFGAGGQFQVSIGDLSYSGNGTQTHSLTITLLSLPQITEESTASLPEPSSLLLLGAGLAGIGLLAARSRRQRASCLPPSPG